MSPARGAGGGIIYDVPSGLLELSGTLSGVVERIRLTSSYQQSPCFVSKVASSDDRAPPAIITVIQLTAFKVVVTDVFNGMMFIHGEVVMFASSSSSSLVGGGVYHLLYSRLRMYRLPLYLLPAT